MKFGLSNDTGAYSTNINIIQGSFRIRVPEGTANSVKRTNKLGDDVYEQTFSSITGYIKKIEFVDTEKYGRKVEITVESDKDYKINMGFADGLACNFYKVLPNVDPALPVRMNLSTNVNTDGKARTSLFINQGDTAYKWAYTRDNPNGMPSMEQIKIKGVETWDNTKQVEFLIKDAVEPFIKKLSTTVRKEVKEEVQEEEVTGKGLDYDEFINPADIPF